MSECNIQNLKQGTKTTVFVVIVFLIIISGVGFGILGWYLGQQHEREGTTVDLTISPDFYVEIVDTVYEMSMPANASCNCSAVMFYAEKISYADFDAVLEYMEANPTYSLDFDDINDITGNDQHQTGYSFEIISDTMMYGPEPSETSNLDGTSWTIDFGNHVVFVMVFVSSYVNGCPVDGMFTFQATADFMGRMSNGTAVYDEIVDSGYVRGLHNTLAINGMVLDEEVYCNSVLDVTWNGDSLDFVPMYI